MKKAIKTGWLVLAVASFLVGGVLMITEPIAHSKFYIYFITALVALAFNIVPGLMRRDSGKKKH